MKLEGFVLESEEIDEMVYCKLHCTFPRLCKEAERVKMQMPLTDVSMNVCSKKKVEVASCNHHSPVK